MIRQLLSFFDLNTVSSEEVKHVISDTSNGNGKYLHVSLYNTKHCNYMTIKNCEFSSVISSTEHIVVVVTSTIHYAD